MTFRLTTGCATNCANAPWVSGPQSVSEVVLCVCMEEILGARHRSRTRVIWLQSRGSTVELAGQDGLAGSPLGVACRSGGPPVLYVCFYTGETLNKRQYRRA